MPALKGISHVELTVTDLDRAAAWWHDIMGFTPVHRGGGETYQNRDLVHPTGVVVSVKTHDEPLTSVFDERCIGLDHISFEVADRDEMLRWLTHLDEMGVAHSGIKETPLGPLVVFRDPDNIQVELYVHPSPEQVMALFNDVDSAEAQQAVGEVGQKLIDAENA
ncbi:VOC family protein [Aldersonia sp. NBC_00410]|uniref:VOC family protein n=1 Tax=Aldersonia sp. NBC_00410 TaxID=2975954 RepID=UPI00225AB16D|nr:VOC family protein [Aldersonia sp. NBC_00410]MCX5042420.1 VOC family protein [Aldersonia sp. NBC_00410]